MHINKGLNNNYRCRFTEYIRDAGLVTYINAKDRSKKGQEEVILL
jgi:hypothetical protein